MSMLLPPLAFVLFLAVAVLLGRSGVKMAPKGEGSAEAKTSYAGGEDIPGRKRFPGYRVFFPIALFFTILHVLALLIGLLPVGAAGLGLVYTGLVCFSLVLLIVR